MFIWEVLIPILMDYPLGGVICKCKVRLLEVLIPILMDYPLGAIKTPPPSRRDISLNPYSNGLPSRGR